MRHEALVKKPRPGAAHFSKNENGQKKYRISFDIEGATMS